jgi:hypothetical protein
MVLRASRIGSADLPYTEELAYQDWAPYSYLDGFYDDPSTRGTTNKRAALVMEGDSKTLQVLLPTGCVTSMCAMQAKSSLILPSDSATLKFKYGSLRCFCIGLSHILVSGPWFGGDGPPHGRGSMWMWERDAGCCLWPVQRSV